MSPSIFASLLGASSTAATLFAEATIPAAGGAASVMSFAALCWVIKRREDELAAMRQHYAEQREQDRKESAAYRADSDRRDHRRAELLKIAIRGGGKEIPEETVT